LPRDIWVPIDGKRVSTGILVYNSVAYRKREIKTEPYASISGNNPAFTIIGGILKSRGYDPKIFDDGTVLLTLPVNDEYGWILREIAKTYALAEKIDVNKITWDLLTTEAKNGVN
jgi:hypothetical protein